MHLADHHRRALLQPVEVNHAGPHEDNDLLENGAEADYLDVVRVRWRVDSTFDFDVSFSLWCQKFDAIVAELRVDGIGPILLLSLHVDEALAGADDVCLALMHQVDDVEDFADLNLIPLEASELQVVQNADVFDLERDLEHVLAAEFF